ncbi:LapA family protein [Mycoplasma crocodyli]|uniref:DUF3899 domain-containing protein n=1 Tax=Mycoplasma crocodyli (strain ATCC 51981 / MP145) TaxID=512564 RepID=D5E601_MYCCM|nr:LapA family protein [Mycoplasma crocodyli]ADE19894.1 conserved hypothetical protein [Mycoplasma crocodyli MP145]
MNIIDKIIKVYEIVGQTKQDTERTTNILIIFFGIAFLIIGIASFFLYPKQKRKMIQYKKEQLEEYYINHPKNKGCSYEASGLFVPGWQRMKYNIPIFVGMTFCIIGVFMIVAKISNIF